MTGSGDASVYEEDNTCGITVNDATVTCSVPCHSVGFSMARNLMIGLLVVLGLAVLLCLYSGIQFWRRSPKHDLSRIQVEKGLVVEELEDGQIRIRRTSGGDSSENSNPSSEDTEESSSAIDEEKQALSQNL